jgi:hypothetical protein
LSVKFGIATRGIARHVFANSSLMHFGTINGVRPAGRFLTLDLSLIESLLQRFDNLNDIGAAHIRSLFCPSY